MKTTRSRILLLTVVLALLAGALPAFAQSSLLPGQTPTYGGVFLQAGFTPDPYGVEVTSGGSLSAYWELGSACSGYINDVPDFNVYWSGLTEDLFIGFTSDYSDADTTLVVRTPEGFYWCSDDAFGLDPEVWLSYPSDGTYQVWVGSYGYGDYHTGTLYVSELG